MVGELMFVVPVAIIAASVPVGVVVLLFLIYRRLQSIEAAIREKQDHK
jgi:hypothetical protein